MICVVSRIDQEISSLRGPERNPSFNLLFFFYLFNVTNAKPAVVPIRRDLITAALQSKHMGFIMASPKQNLKLIC